ncbi:uncharacterized protein CTHT_0007840 [Thermochaetoides thermophila DSM 1495]|uniref:Phosphoinositide phospholipase C n=1 Tax=Chaetomium thermophilum (strain DSM 1495 / CBS 144.50 / IMI 039719) TaxID=759272 RepID=G0RYT6_CHATD|nr:hypothetical protein CTHT_0007840 [Thermochaetoides thermophila DSM 1495]EGS24072.1 hypothetical protein CTHT_0007840 [Thermochaetoides thermophila DSM 1495]
MSTFNLFKSKAREDDEDDRGEAIDSETIAGGGHSTEIAHHRLRVSQALRSFLAHEGLLSNEQDEEALNALLDRPVVSPPASVLDRSHPLPEYFISSSHNTYLLAHQLYGSSAAEAYETTLKAGARCIEIDAWYVFRIYFPGSTLTAQG